MDGKDSTSAVSSSRERETCSPALAIDFKLVSCFAGLAGPVPSGRWGDASEVGGLVGSGWETAMDSVVDGNNVAI